LHRVLHRVVVRATSAVPTNTSTVHVRRPRRVADLKPTHLPLRRRSIAERRHIRRRIPSQTVRRPSLQLWHVSVHLQDNKHSMTTVNNHTSNNRQTITPLCPKM
jgi:hypothetical protein